MFATPTTPAATVLMTQYRHVQPDGPTSKEVNASSVPLGNVLDPEGNGVDTACTNFFSFFFFSGDVKKHLGVIDIPHMQNTADTAEDSACDMYSGPPTQV